MAERRAGLAEIWGGARPTGAGHGPSVRLLEDDPIPPEYYRPAPSRETVARLYQAHGSSLTAFLRRQISRERAPDLLHHVFARFLGLAPDKRAAIDSPEAYLKRTARNLVRDERKLARRREAAFHLADTEVSLTAHCQIAALEARDMLSRIETSIEKLKPITRQIFLAHRVDGYSYAEIAERTGLSVKGVEKHMSRAIAHIDRAFAQR
jgi:RNA polymerase sigma factor (sigma-70 family)